ncbi:MAG: 30S ribosomal protein S5 [Candidatus Nealsonbacteria bacterium RIFCSPLOWO2_01_FULL_43_32]|uniref:Small ribosomal subunit protein uS5 n=1 Tax=Candidatus Nealsonbacteria bacterium RIFCSPLOWO2_01_FULL_43_32 TaxID=1801672 RepID=A0A1G2EG74_9BACT|nr:MAG: 30S ribosomal protein S5 [Candidatus Nealsonbacteria bacterium RIFCSPLOWO2_01_FULL_43_32]
MPRDRFRKFDKERPKDEFESKLLDLARIAHTRAGGRKMRFRAVMITGDKKGKVGLGIAKGADVQIAIEKATRLSKKYLMTVPIVSETIPHEVAAKVGAAMVLLRPQRKGRGLVAGGTVRVVCTLAGIKNISSKILSKTGNKISNARATMEALRKLRKFEARNPKHETNSNDQNSKS